MPRLHDSDRVDTLLAQLGTLERGLAANQATLIEALQRDADPEALRELSARVDILDKEVGRVTRAIHDEVERSSPLIAFALQVEAIAESQPGDLPSSPYLDA